MPTIINRIQTFIKLFAIAMCGSVLLFVLPASADNIEAERGTAAQAQVMVAQAIVLYNAKGENVAFNRFTENPAPDFKRLDLYIFVMNAMDGKLVAHALSRSIVGVDARELIDPNGVSIGQVIMDVADLDGEWADYSSIDPASGEIIPKSSWVVLHDGYIFGCGIYPR